MSPPEAALASPESSAAIDGARHSFLRGVQLVEAMVESQAQEFVRRSISPPPVEASLMTEVIRLQKSGASAAERLSLLVRMQEEVFRRQRILDEAAFAPGGEISLEAFIGAAHKIRTALDVALNCSGEIVDIIGANGHIDEIKAPAQDVARAARWAVKYAEELSDLALLDQSDQSLSRFSGNEAIRAVAAKLKTLAVNSGIALEVRDGVDVPFYSDRVRFERCLHYLLIWALDGKGVSKVHVSLGAAGADALITIIDDGAGGSIEDRAAGTLPGAAVSAKRAADGAGYAMARRLAYSLKGLVTLTTTMGAGAQIEMRLPRTLS